MAAYSKFLDTPNGIIIEGQEIGLTFTRTSDTTGELTWNIPSPSAGCSSANQAYNGIVLTVASQPANYTTTSPVNGTFYTGDPTVDPDLNMGSKLGPVSNTASVVGAFYDNKTTTSLSLTGLQPLTAYYFSAYAVDNVTRYHTAGVHSYSLPTGSKRPNNEKNLPAIQDVGIDSSNNHPLTPHSWTGLKESKQYALTMVIDGKKYRMGIDGIKSLDYAGLINTINSEFIRLTENKYSAPYPATANGYYVNVDTQTVVYTSIIATVINITNSKNAVITVNTVSETNPFINSHMINVNGAAMMTNDNVYGNILIAGGQSGAWTLTTDINTIGLPTYTSGGIVYAGWDGTVPNVLPCEFNNDDPNTPIAGTFWYNPDTQVLSQWNGTVWVTLTYLTSEYDFSNPQCYEFWFNGVNVYEWEKVLWCQLQTYVQDTNPLIPPVLDCNTFWYNTINNMVSQWNVQLQAWNAVNAIYSDYDPNTIASGAFWYNTTLNQVNYYASTMWNLLTVSMIEADAEGNYPGTIFANMYWFIPSTKTLFKRDAANTVWVQKDVVSFATDPTNRTACELWWNSATDILYIWDTVNARWTKVSQFWQQAVDPASIPDIPLDAAWYNPVTQILTIINNPDCSAVNFVYDTSDPTIMTLNELWYNPVTQVWSQWNGTGWNIINVITKTTDPYVLITGELWFDTPASQLNQWNGTGWTLLPYSTTPLIPTAGTLWHNSVTDALYSWEDGVWVPTIGVAAAKLVLRNNHKCDRCNGGFNCYEFYWNLDDGWAVPFERDFIRFYTNIKGCKERIELCWNDDGYGGHQHAYVAQELYAPVPPNQDLLFANLGSMIYFRPQRGYTALPSPPMYQQLGVGTDGAPDARRELQGIIRSTLGDPGKKVELTKYQLDVCIDNALKMLRKNSTLSYNRGFFFLDVFPCQQSYKLKDECVGFNTIVSINAITRCQGFFGLGGQGFGNDGIFAYGALQQLYTLGTFDILSYHLVTSYVKELQILFANNITFQWIEKTRDLKMYKTFYAFERVLIDGVVERTEQDLLTDRDTTMWLQRWAIAEAKLQLSMVRGAFVTLPGPTGNVTMNAQDLLTQAQQEMTTLEEELHDPVMSGPQNVGLHAHFLFG